MPETFDEIIEEIEQLDSCGNYHRYLLNHNLENRHNWASTDMALDIAARVREAVGGDPAEWWVLDADGERVHIGDEIVGSCFCGTRTVKGFYRGEKDIMHMMTGVAECHSHGHVHKVVPDSREKIVYDTVDKLIKTANLSADKMREIIGAAIDRGAKLPEVDA